MTLGSRIRAARQAAGYSQETFASALGTSRRMVSRWENDKARPGAAYAVRINRLTGLVVPPRYELEREQNETLDLLRELREAVQRLTLNESYQTDLLNRMEAQLLDLVQRP